MYTPLPTSEGERFFAHLGPFKKSWHLLRNTYRVARVGKVGLLRPILIYLFSINLLMDNVPHVITIYGLSFEANKVRGR